MRIKACWLIAVGSVLIGKLCLFAGENTSVSKQTSPGVPIQMTGRIIAVDETLHTCTVQIEGRIYLLNLKANTAVSRQRKKLTLKDLMPRQSVTLTLAADHGQVEVVSIVIVGSKEPAEAAGSAVTGTASSWTSASGSGSPKPPEDAPKGRSASGPPVGGSAPPPPHAVAPHLRTNVSPFN